MKINFHTHKTSFPGRDAGVLEIVNHIVSSVPPADLQGKYVSLGIHPWYIGNPEVQLRVLEECLATNENIFAVGEAGLDKLRGAVPMEVQCDVFRQQALLAEQYSMPLVIHCVRAFDEMLALRKSIMPSVLWIVHGFRGNHIQAQQLVRNGFAISFGQKFNCLALKAVFNDTFFLETDDSDVSISEVYESAASVLEIATDDLEELLEERFRSLKSGI